MTNSSNSNHLHSHNSAYSKTSSSSSLSADEEDPIKGKEDKKPAKSFQTLKVYWSYLRPLAIMLIISVGIPLALYYVLKIWLSTLVALLISGISPLLHMVYVFWKYRRIGVLDCIFVAGFIISAVLSIISGDARLTLLRDSTVTAVVSALFLLTLIPIRTKWFTVRPIIFLFIQQLFAEQPPVEWKDKEDREKSMERSEWIWQTSEFFRKYCYFICAVWGVLLMSEFAAKVIMIKSTLTIDQVVLYSSIMVIAIVVGMTTVTIILSKYVGKRITKDVEAWAKENTLNGEAPK